MWCSAILHLIASGQSIEFPLSTTSRTNAGVIETTDLTKTFKDRKRGAFHAVDRLNLCCRPGEIFGLLGPNGAGKTTALRMISTALKPSSGSGKVLGHDLLSDSAKVRATIGFLAANTGLYGRLTPREVLRYFGSLHGMSRKRIAERTEALAETFDMDFLDRPCDKLSTGMKQKTNIARSILHEPPVIILDEPTAGLDVITSRSIIDFIRKSREDGKTVLLSTHIMSEVERLCDHVGIIHQGKMLFEGTLEDLRKVHPGHFEDAFIHLVEEAEK